MKAIVVLCLALLLAPLTTPAMAQAPATDIRIALTGTASTAGGDQIRYAITVLRYAPDDAKLTPDERSRATVFVATCTLTDVTTRSHAIAQRFGRAGIDDVTLLGDDASVTIGDWKLRTKTISGVASVYAEIDDPHLHLQLEARGGRPPGAPFIPPMRTAGYVDGMDTRGVSSFAIDSDPRLVDGVSADRMVAIVNIRGDCGVHTIRIIRFNDDDQLLEATMIDPNGRITRFGPGAVRVSFHGNNRWMSSETSRSYATTLAITIPSLGIFMSISPAVTDQEFVAIPRVDSFWEGAVLIEPLDPVRQVYGEGILTASGRRTDTS